MPDNCPEISRNLSACLDGALDAETRTAVEAHLAACAACAGELRLISSLDADLKKLPAVETPPFFTARVMAAVRSMGRENVSLRRFLRLPVPAMALMVSFILINLFTFAFNINAMENGPRRELARKIASQLAKPASIINPVALVRLCGECNKYMCLCMHESGKKSICPCRNCEMGKQQKQAEDGKTMNMDSHGELR